jgi:hypothetical protein
MTAPRDQSTIHPDGTPVASVVPNAVERNHEGLPAQILEDQIPHGNPASAEAIAGIRESLEGMLGCRRAGDEGRLAAFYSDDYFRREWVRKQRQLSGSGEARLWNPEDRQILAFEDARELPDGRVGIIARPREGHGSLFIIFVHQDDRWLIDEMYEVGSGLG